jgi:hypothetical protein
VRTDGSAEDLNSPRNGEGDRSALPARSAIMLGTAIMASNVVVNGYTMPIGFEEFLIPWLLQSGFALFVFSVAWRHWAIRHSNVEAQ